MGRRLEPVALPGWGTVESIRQSVEIVADLVQDRAGHERAVLVFADRTWSGRGRATEGATVATLLPARRRKGPIHTGVLLDNVAEYTFVLLKTSGGRSTRRGPV
jgi:hypothetical protein